MHPIIMCRNSDTGKKNSPMEKFVILILKPSYPTIMIACSCMENKIVVWGFLSTFLKKLTPNVPILGAFFLKFAIPMLLKFVDMGPKSHWNPQLHILTTTHGISQQI